MSTLYCAKSVALAAMALDLVDCTLSSSWNASMCCLDLHPRGSTPFAVFFSNLVLGGLALQVFAMLHV